MSMKKLARASAAVALMVGSATVLADPNPPLAGQVLVAGRPNAINNGGEFRIEVVGGAGLAAMGFHAGRVFDTFCIELDETVNVGNTYDVYINDTAYGGGADTGGGSGFSGDGDPLSAQTAYLYTQFWNGSLAFYEFGESGETGGGLLGGLNRAQTARALQLAIWVLEGEIADVTGAAGTSAERDLADWYIFEANNSGWTTIGQVRVLNMGTNGQNQDMLIIIPLPQAGALAALGIGGLAIRRRRPVL